MNKAFDTYSDELISQLKKLTQLSLTEFEIQISYQKMISEQDYRELVLKELYELNHPEIIEIINWINNYSAAENQSSPAEHSDSQNNKKRNLLLPLSLFFVSVIAVMAFLLVSQNSGSDILRAAPQVKHQATPIEVKTVQTTKKIKLTLPVKEAEVSFKLHGSNTIGEKLAPALLVKYLELQGVKDFEWIQGDSPVERTLQYIKNNKVYAIELHAHGSSTGFKDLKLGKADLGMASRRVKQKEVIALKSQLGNLNKVGNEHIIGLDGLAVIVNQNNPIAHISTDKLSKIFSGEINNWSQLGGTDLPIKVFSRDAKSGTWDTFKNLVLKKFSRELAVTATRLESSSELSTLISQDEAAIGFIGLNYVLHNKALAISEGVGTTAIFPTRFTIGTEDYALARRLYFYTPTSASNIVKDFAQFAISQQGQDIVEKTGLISQNIKVENAYPMQDAPIKYNKYTKIAKRLSLNFRFNYGNKDLDNKGKRDLQRLISFMEQNEGRRLVLMGFSDSIGAKLKNIQLSLTRAKSVERELVARGIPVMAVEGLGEAIPVANNETESGRERNRRVEVWLL
ncbi:substrate-binding domain-containing protein [Pseudoalteromonas sp. C2R02]|uniref:substrate-binding domain-containing protein n=1 Tax=Pseudoalteromonas sp. C2R02 TaxID=2841565 RepID=UPI001C099F1E|nr:phosphate ABC transporter substrate-binding/OmpA family protein [Pseudoalteromonas sp. C2R02]MBU2970044.1 substrate-binding domain-containing protein [Pseudoalteromonas sp. C2R02]